MGWTMTLEIEGSRIGAEETAGPRARLVPRPRRPPTVGATVLVCGPERALSQPLELTIDGRQADPATWEAVLVERDTLLVEVQPEAFPWTQSEPVTVRLELLLGGRRILAERIELEPFQTLEEAAQKPLPEKNE